MEEKISDPSQLSLIFQLYKYSTNEDEENIYTRTQSINKKFCYLTIFRWTRDFVIFFRIILKQDQEFEAQGMLIESKLINSST